MLCPSMIQIFNNWFMALFATSSVPFIFVLYRYVWAISNLQSLVLFFFSVWVFLSPVSFMLYIINILCTNVFCLLRKSNRGKVSLGICNASAKGSRGREKDKSRCWVCSWRRKAGNLAKKEIHPTPRHNNKHGPESNSKPLLGFISFSVSYSCVTGLGNYGKKHKDEPGTWGFKIYATTRVP